MDQDKCFPEGWWAINAENDPDITEGCHLLCVLITGKLATLHDWMGGGQKGYTDHNPNPNRRLRGYTGGNTYGNVCQATSGYFQSPKTGTGSTLMWDDWILFPSKAVAKAMEKLVLTLQPQGIGFDNDKSTGGNNNLKCGCEF